MARNVYQYEQPRCPDNWNEAERRFYNRLIETLDDIYAKYGRIDDRTLLSGIQKVESMTKNTLDKLETGVVSAGTVATDALSATFGYIASLSGKYGSFDFETVKNLLAQAMVLEKGQADYIHITNLAATYAQAVNATIGNLVIQASNGRYYQLDVGTDGRVSAEQVDVSDNEIAAGETESGKVLVATNIAAETLGAETLAATQALINALDAARINVDTLIARQEFVQDLTASDAFINALIANSAFIKELSTTKIIGDKSIEMIAEDVDGTAKVFRQATAPTEGVRENDLWVIPGTERIYQATISDVQPTFYLDENGILTAEFPEGFDDGSYRVFIQDRDLYTDGFMLNVVEGGVIGDGFSWMQIGDRELADAVSELQHSVFVKPDGLHVQAEGSGTEVVIDSNSVDIRVGGVPFSSFGSNYVEFGDYQMRRTADGGLAFKKRSGYNSLNLKEKRLIA